MQRRRWVAQILVVGSIPTALASEEERLKDAIYEITEQPEGRQKRGPLLRDPPQPSAF
jgi:hypothetical protein